MIAHIIHDNKGSIRSVVIQSTEIEGELEIQTDQEGDLVSTVDLRGIYPVFGFDLPKDSEKSRRQHHFIARDIRMGFRFDVKRKRLERLAGAKADESG